MGRNKVEMKKIEDKSARIVTFSKRKGGLFKKAFELSTLCGAEIAVITRSPAQKVYAFGQPSVEAVVDKFLGTGRRAAAGEGSSSAGVTPENDVGALRRRLQRLSDEIEAEKVKKKMMKTVDAEPIDVKNLGIEELLRLKQRMEVMRDAVNKRVGEIESEAAESLILLKNSAD